MIGIGTFVLGKEKDSKSDKIRMFSASEWVPHYDRKAGGSRHYTRFVTLKFMGYKKEDIGNWNEGDTVFVSGVYSEDPYMGKLGENNEQMTNAGKDYEPRAGGEILVDTCVEVQFSKTSKDKLDVQNGGWGFKNNNGNSGGNNSNNSNSGNSGSYTGRTGNNAQRTNTTRSNSGQQTRQSQNDGDDYEEESRGSSNNRQQSNRTQGNGNGGNGGRNNPAPSNEEVDEFDNGDLELPDV